MQKKVIYKIVFNRKNKLNKNGEAPIQIEAYLDRKRKYFGTGIYIKPVHWNENKKIINAKHNNSAKLNQTIALQLKELEEFEFKTYNEKGIFSLNDFYFNNTEQDFFSFFDEIITKIETSRIYKSGLIRTLKYLKELEPNMSFKNINYEFIIKYDYFLHQQKYHINTIARYHKNFRHLLNIAIKHKKITESPYKNFKITEIESTRTALTIEEINKIEEIEISYEALNFIKDIFLFSCYTGLRFSDLQAITPKMIEKTDDGVFLAFRQQKTKGLIKIPLHLLFEGKAIKIIDKYFDELNKYIFPRISNQEANRKLKLIQTLIGSNKILTFHVSRHTFGTLMAYYTNDPYLIQALMGHKDYNTSMTYIHMSNNLVNNKLKDVKW